MKAVLRYYSASEIWKRLGMPDIDPGATPDPDAGLYPSAALFPSSSTYPSGSTA